MVGEVGTKFPCGRGGWYQVSRGRLVPSVHVVGEVGTKCLCGRPGSSQVSIK